MSTEHEPGNAGAESEEHEPTTFAAGPYEASKAGMTWYQPTRDGKVPRKLCNYRAFVVSEETYDDGAEQSAHFEVRFEGATRSASQLVPAERLAFLHDYATKALMSEAILEVGQGLRDHLRNAVLALSRERGIVSRETFGHTGWRKLRGGWAYLHGGGAVGEDGDVPEAFVRLDGALSGFVLQRPDDQVEAVRASLALLDVAEPSVMVPLLGAVFRSVLGAADFGVFLAGRTGCMKSTVAALAQQHFGAGLGLGRAPMAWNSTDNAIGAATFCVKDAVLLVDDFAPEGSPLDVAKLHKTAANVFRAQGNNAGRNRSRQDGSLRPARPPRGLVLATGEDVPKGHSIRARLAIVEMRPGDVFVERLNEVQAFADAGGFTGATWAFVRWLAPRAGDLAAMRAGQLPGLRDSFGTGAHARTSGALADLALGWWHFLDMAEGIGAVTAAESEYLWVLVVEVLRTLGAAQSEHQSAADPPLRFLELLAEGMTANKCHLADEEDRWPSGERIGFEKGEEVFLIPAAAMTEAARLDRDNVLGLSESVLGKRMKERGLIVPGPSGNKLQRTHEGRKSYGWVLTPKGAAILRGEEPEKPETATMPGPSGSGSGPPGLGFSTPRLGSGRETRGEETQASQGMPGPVSGNSGSPEGEGPSGDGGTLLRLNFADENLRPDLRRGLGNLSADGGNGDSVAAGMSGGA